MDGTASLANRDFGRVSRTKGRKCFSPVPRVSRPSLAGFDRAKVETELAQEAAAGLLRRDESAELFRAIGPSANNGG
jgi:hypothetical protein